MTTYPLTPRADFIEWAAAHVPAFTAKPESIGLSDGQAAEFVIRVDGAAKALLEQQAARQAALVATRKAEAAVAALRAATGSAVRSIRAFAEATGDPKVYAEAQIAPPAHRSPAPPPAKPSRLNATLEAATGALTISWQARQPAGASGTTYLVRRRLPGEGVFTFVGVAGKKTFVDDSLPGGVATAEYTVTPQRGARAGAVSAILTVNFGSAGAGANGELRRAKGEGRLVNGKGRLPVDAMAV